MRQAFDFRIEPTRAKHIINFCHDGKEIFSIDFNYDGGGLMTNVTSRTLNIWDYGAGGLIWSAKFPT